MEGRKCIRNDRRMLFAEGPPLLSEMIKLLSTLLLLLSVFVPVPVQVAAQVSDYDSVADFGLVKAVRVMIRQERQVTSELCDFGSDGELSFCDFWSTKNGTGPKWELGAGSLSNWIGGPPKDASATTNERGGYAFFETSLLGSADTRTPSSAIMDSRTLELTGPEGKCLTFSYSLDGLSAAGLRILLRPARRDDTPLGPDRELWAARDPTGKRWAAASVLYTFNTDHQLVMEGIARDPTDSRRKFRGHVAVDDVAIKAGTECKGHCTFEGGFCGWTNEDTEDDFDWQLGRGSQSPATGPATDRSSFTYGGLQGGYVFIDSGFPRRPGDSARLISPDFEATDRDQPLCLKFWTHMFGNGIGSLSILTVESQEGNRNVERLLWSLSGEAGNGWYQAQVTVSSNYPFKIILLGRVGKNTLGDIAVDDISLSPGSCPTAPQAAASSRTDCTFEVDECGWMNVPARERSDDIDWERVSGLARRDSVRDHTLATDKGSLMTLEKANVQRPGNRAWLMSERINGTDKPMCLSFWYLMNEPFIDPAGPSLGSLTVVVRPVGEEKAAAWRLYNNQGPEWKYAQTAILSYKEFHIIFEGSWGSGRANGLIAVDDISVFPSDCTTLPPAATVRNVECHFERDICSWSNDSAPATWRLATLSRRPPNLPDRTFSSPEGYIFFDQFSTNKKVPRDVAKIVSAPVTTNDASEGQVYCLTFWYAAFGVGDSGELRVVRADNNTGEISTRSLWVLSSTGLDTAHPQWAAAQVLIENGVDLTLSFEGSAANGGFAIDDVSLMTANSCPIRPLAAEPLREEERKR